MMEALEKSNSAAFVKSAAYQNGYAVDGFGRYNFKVEYVFSWPGLISLSVEYLVPVASMSPGRS
jgi:hypothetical protein